MISIGLSDNAASNRHVLGRPKGYSGLLAYMYLKTPSYLGG